MVQCQRRSCPKKLDSLLSDAPFEGSCFVTTVVNLATFEDFDVCCNRHVRCGVYMTILSFGNYIILLNDCVQGQPMLSSSLAISLPWLNFNSHVETMHWVMCAVH